MDWLIVPGATAGPAAYVAAGVVAVMLVAVSKGGFGSGLGMLSVPVLMQVMPAPRAVALMLPVLIFCDLLAISQYPRDWRPRDLLLVAPGVLTGIVAGWLILAWAGSAAPEELKRNEAWLKLLIGAICLGFVGTWAAAERLRRREAARPAWEPTWLGGTLTGIPSGVTTMLAHAAGPIYTMFLLPQKLDKRTFVGTTVRYFLVFNLVKVPFFLTVPGDARLTWPIFKCALWMMAFAPLGVLAGRKLNDKLNPAAFNILIYVFLAAAGGKLLWDGAVALWLS